MTLTLRIATAATALLAALVALPQAVGAQAPTKPEWNRVSETARLYLPAAAPISSASLPVRVLERPLVQRKAEAGSRHKDKATGRTLMIAGGAMFVAGLIIGDTGGTLIAVGGIGIGAYGLYMYLE